MALPVRRGGTTSTARSRHGAWRTSSSPRCATAHRSGRSSAASLTARAASSRRSRRPMASTRPTACFGRFRESRTTTIGRMASARMPHIRTVRLVWRVTLWRDSGLTMASPMISQTGMAIALGLSPRGNSFPSFIASQAMSDSVGGELRAKLKKPIAIQWGGGGGEPPIVAHRQRRSALDRSVQRHR